MSKYFSYDAIDVNLYVHDTAEEAKQSALDIAEDGYNLSSDQYDGLSKGSQDLIKSICYGVILGGIDLPVRQTSVEQDGADAVAKFKYMVQAPVIVEYEQYNGWIKCSERLPKIFDHNGFERSDVVLCFGIDEPDCDETYVLAYMVRGNRFYGFNGECTDITYWRPVPMPPQEFIDKYNS